MKYLDKKFSSPANSRDFVANWDAVFGEKEAEDYVPPERIVVDDETFDRLTDAIENPRPPNDALIALFKKQG